MSRSKQSTSRAKAKSAPKAADTEADTKPDTKADAETASSGEGVDVKPPAASDPEHAADKAADTEADTEAATDQKSPESRAAAPPQPSEDERRAASKRPQDRLSSKERTENAKKLQLLQQELDQARALLAKADGRIRDLESEVGHLRLAPGRAVPMSPLEIREQLERDGRSRFRVLENYRHMGAVMPKGRELDARLFPRLMDHVMNGLQLVLVEKPKPAAGKTR